MELSPHAVPFYCLLDTRGMYSAVDDQLLEADSRHFPANRVKSGKYNCFRRVVDDEIDSGSRFDRTDVSSFPSDDLPYPLIIGRLTTDTVDSAT